MSAPFRPPSFLIWRRPRVTSRSMWYYLRSQAYLWYDNVLNCLSLAGTVMLYDCTGE